MPLHNVQKYNSEMEQAIRPTPGVGNLFMLEGRINLAVIK
jgi:hypothetical protein